MTIKQSFKNRLLSGLLCFAIILSMLPISFSTAVAADQSTAIRVADPSTMDGWKNFFSNEGDLSTENAGGVWMDKSVFTDAAAFSGTGISQNEDDSFLVALSAIASNMTITGMSNVPTDTILTLDVSGSMNDNSGNNDVAEELVDAANESIAALLSTNKYNRVGVVLYSGTRSSATNSDAAIVLLPLGRYSTGNDGEYLNYNVSGRGNTTETVSLDSDVVYEGTATKPTSVNKEVVGATYIQKGVVLAMNQFIDEDNSVTVEDSAVGSLQRKPVLVLMSDGAPTLGSTNFTNPGQYNLGDGSNSSAALGFVTQLSAAYAKAKIEEKYGTESLFYTLGLGVSNNSIAVSVLDPDNANASTAVNDFWTQYNAAAVGNTVNVQGRRTTVTKIATDLEQNYVDEYFSADGSSGDLASELKQAFADIVGSIQLQSSYYPTLISENEDLSGYVSFVDRIGEYMKVTDIKGILIEDHLFSGTDLASNFVSGGGNLGTYDNPTSLGIEMVHAVQKRLGIDSEDTARTLIGLAYEYGQLSYTDENSYSNYIGWYANAAGEFLGFYQNGVTVLPEATGNVTTDPAFTIKSYGYLGAVDESHGMSKSDMMYATVQVRENIVTGEQIVTFAVPAALIPVITYEVTLEENGDLADLTAVGANNPIRLVYEVALDDEINSFNVKEVVSAEYLTENSNADGSVNFYPNQWDHKNTTGYGTVNTYSYFNPSRQNDRYYYTEDTLLYADTNGHLYEYSGAVPFDMPYRAQTVYKKINGTFSKETKYIAISDEAEATAKINSDGVYYVPQGNVYVNLDGYTVNKTENKTNTLSQSNIPFVDTQNHKVDDTGYNFYVGATLGNNGRLTLAAETGIRLTKTMAADAATPTGAFAFALTNTTNTADNSSYPAWLIKADRTEISTEVKFNNGTATVELNADDVLYIGGMTANDTIRITENATAEYIAQTVGLSDADTITINSGIMAEVEFINSNRGTGNLTVVKEVEHDFGTDYEIPADKTFTMTVTLSGIGTTNATFEARQTDSDITEIKTDENGCLTVTLKHEEQFEIFGLPAGTIATVVEQNPGTGFTAAYWDNGQLGDGSVTVIEDNTVSVIVVNDYTAKAVYPVNLNLSGSKYIEDENGEPVAQWDDDYSFTVVLERYGADGWETVDTKIVSKDNQKFAFDMSKETYDAPGVYSYQLYEKTGSINGMLYDNTWHTFSVYVEDANMDGQLEIVRVHSEHANKDFELVNGEYNIVTDFTNVQTVTVPALATIELQKVLKNDSGSTRVSLAGYTFGLYTDMACTIPATAGNGIYDIDIAPTDAIGEGWIDVLLDQAGTYTFYVKEESGDISEMTYSTEVIKVVIEVSASDTDSGVLVANVSYYDSDGIPYTLGDDGEVEITNTYDPTDAELVIDFVSKQLNGRAMTQDDVFSFEVQDLNGTPLLEGKNNASGVVTFNGNLKYDKVGTYYYNIVETSVDGDGITTDKTTYRMVVSVSDHDGVLSAQYVLVNVVGNEIVFKNSYIAEPAKHIISGNKTLSGRVLLNDEFSFVLTDVSYNGVAVSNPSSWTVHNFADGSFKFPEMTYTKAGTYIYSVSEIIPDSGKIYGITYDTASYYVTVVVEDNGEGSLEIVSESYSLIDGAAATALTFANTYIPEKTTAQFTGDKELTGKVNNALLGGEYAFTLYASDANWTQGSKIETVNNGVNGLIEFTAIDFETDEDKYYIVKENNAGETIDGVTYDDTVYRVWVEVTDDLKGQLHATVHIYDDYGVPQEEILFINTYEVTGSDTVSLSGTKTINGRVLASDDVFTFELYEADENFAIGSEVKDTAKNDTVTGTYKFNISYTAENVGNIYYYVIKEKDAGKTINGVTNSTAEYHITVKVEDDDKGGIKTTVIIENATASTLDFVNEYKPNAVTKQFEGTKELTGKTLTDDVFQFELYASDADWTEGALLQTKFNTDGKFVFDEIEFTTVEDKYYLVVEKYAGETINGITYDDTVYRVFVDVSDSLKGNLTATVSIFKNDGSSASEIEFTNKYDITGTCSVELSGEKSMDGRPLTADDIFTFEVYEADKKFETLGNEPVTTVDTNVVTGKFSLSITYSADDVGKTYYYVVKEKNAGETVDGITYSTQKYNVTVTVDDNGVGGVKATATVNDGAVTVDALDFTNKYEPAKAVKVFEGTKTLDGIREIKANDFTFDLYLTNEDFAIESTAVQSVKNDKEGNFKFDEVEFTAVGTYYFVVKENSQTPIGGVTYDASVYHITVKVTDNGKGQLEVSETSMLRVNGNTSEKATVIAFVNEYSATDVTVSLGGEKKLTGRQLTDGEFKFLLYSANSEFAIAEDATVMEALNKADGSFTFDALTFSQPGMYYYVIREDATVNAERITFDDTVYRITIEVKDNENGKLTASEPIIVKAETVDTVDSVAFENVYTPKPTDISVDIKVHKTVVNKGSESITPKDFEFILESVTDSTDRLTVKTDKDGDAIFTLTFTENDIGKSFNYKLSEVNSGRANIQYSTTEYAICITVSLDDNNNLVTTITNNDATVTEVVAEFENVYDYTPENPGDPDNPDNPDDPDVPDSPQTGDNTNLGLWFALLFISGGAIITLTVVDRKRRITGKR